METKIDNTLLDSLTKQAKASPRLRMNYDLRNSTEDTSQRMLNAIEPGSEVPVHRHRKTSETVVVLRGRIMEEFYNDVGKLVESIEVSPCGSVCALNIPTGTWHTLRSLESGTVILEMKDGAYEPIGKEDVMNVCNEVEKSDLAARLREFMEEEARSCSMEPALVTPEYVYRMWGGKVELKDIKKALKKIPLKLN